MKFIENVKAYRIVDIFPGSVAQVNVNRCSIPFLKPEWHAHERQTDYFFCLKGSFLIGTATGPFDFHYGQPDPNEFQVGLTVLSERTPQVLTMLPYVFHTYMALEPDSIILFGMKEKFDPKDLYKLPAGYFNESWEIK